VNDVPALRIRACNHAAARADGGFVLYWMIAQRRASWNFALQRALEWAQRLGRPLLVLEALRCGYRWASDRLHRFVLDGMADNAAAFAAAGVAYHAYVEDAPDAGKGLLAALSATACVVVTDEFPCFFLPRMVAAAAELCPVLMEAVDGNGLLPLRAATAASPSAYAFRRFLQRELAPHLERFPAVEPLAGHRLPRLARIPAAIAARWPMAASDLLTGSAAALARLPIDHRVGVVATRGGAAAARARLRGFLDRDLARYVESRNAVDDGAASGLSPYLHFGHMSAHQVVAEMLGREGWSPARLSGRHDGKKGGWWGASAAAEAFLDQMVTWRELGYVFAHLRPDHERYESLPPWARATLEAHAGDPREHRYTLAQFAAAETHDPLWNAAQTELLREGRMHNYLRMLWGKKILEWTAHPREALAVMIELNNRYALDGRDPNSSSGICWCLGRFDRPWAPQRPVFGQIRFMSSASTLRKLRLKGYLATYGAGPSEPEAPGSRVPASRRRRRP
jgi:deoxyribodipyrimidine photo-lyase